MRLLPTLACLLLTLTALPTGVLAFEGDRSWLLGLEEVQAPGEGTPAVGHLAARLEPRWALDDYWTVGVPVLLGGGLRGDGAFPLEGGYAAAGLSTQFALDATSVVPYLQAQGRAGSLLAGDHQSLVFGEFHLGLGVDYRPRRDRGLGLEFGAVALVGDSAPQWTLGLSVQARYWPDDFLD